MKYMDGQIVRLGDKVRLGSDGTGTVVFSVDTSEYSTSYPAADWAHLKSGAMFLFEKYGLIHYTEPEEDLVLIERASPTARP